MFPLPFFHVQNEVKGERMQEVVENIALEQSYMARKITGREKKQIEAIIAKNKQIDKHKISAQDSIPFRRMYPDGICRVNDNTYTKTIRFADINYQLSTNEDKSARFDGWCDFLNYFDSSIKFQLSLAIADYIDYYNNRRIQAKTKWMLPSKFRKASIPNG